MRNQGFTLVEMAILIVILGILSALAMPQIVEAMNQIKLNSAGQKLASDIRYARELALSRHGVFGVEFDLEANNYQLFEVIGVNKNVMTNPHTGAAMVIDLDNLAEFSGVTITDADHDEIRINAFGTPSTSAGVNLTAPSSITLQNGGLNKVVAITHETGFVELV